MPGRPALLSMLPFAALAAFFATICDANHVFTNTLSYTDPKIFGQPWTVFPSFFLVFLLMMVLYDRLFTKLPAKILREISTSHGSLWEFTESFTIFILVYLMSGFGHEYSMAMNYIFYGAFLVRLIASYEHLFIVIFAIVLAIGGMAGEGLLVEGGLVNYSHPEIFHVPFWLGAVYLHGAMALREGMRYFVYQKAEVK